ncbi:MAG: OmpA family protein [Acetobacteraceae bacterium]
MRAYVYRAALLLPLAATACVPVILSKSEYDKLLSDKQQLQQQNAALSRQVAAENAQVARLQGAIKYTVNSDLLFAPGSWEMKPDGKQVIARLASQLAPTQQNKLVVNGYTDSAPIGPELRRQGVTSNLILSQRRADAVMNFLISQGVKPDMITARGYGDARPVASNATEQGRAQNRRVELTLAGS